MLRSPLYTWALVFGAEPVKISVGISFAVYLLVVVRVSRSTAVNSYGVSPCEHAVATSGGRAVAPNMPILQLLCCG